MYLISLLVLTTKCSIFRILVGMPQTLSLQTLMLKQSNKENHHGYGTYSNSLKKEKFMKFQD